VDELIRVSQPQNAVVTITLARPRKKNALSIALRDQVSDALDRLAEDPQVSVVVLTGEGDTFSAGFDLAEFASPGAEHQERLWESSDRFHRTVLHCPLPTLAAVNGPALAGGFDLAVLCDLRIAGHTARFAHPERSFAEVLYSPLHDLVGGARARELALGGRALTAEEALAWGLVSAVVPADQLAAEAARLAATVAEIPRHLLLRTKAKALARAHIPPGTPTLDL
jgi:enoyl-CoA hydratase/carnithine racemase